MEKTIKPAITRPIVVPIEGIAYCFSRENGILHSTSSRTLNLLRPVWWRTSPTSPKELPRPLVIHVNGSAFSDSVPWANLSLMTYLAQQGYVVASIDYSTFNFLPFPGQIEEVKMAIRFLRKNAASFGIDPDRIALLGESAGGQLVSLAGVTCDSDLFSVGENLEVSEHVSAVVDLYGMHDFTGYASADLHFNYLGGRAKAEANAAKASAVSYVTEKTPPFLLLHGTKDATVPPEQSRLLYDALQKKGVESDLVWLEGSDHADAAFEQDEVFSLVLEFLDKHLK